MPKDMASIAGRRVLLTRPKHQAKPLAEALIAAGAKPIVLPTLEIAAVSDIDKRCNQLLSTSFDWFIFVSTNAVTHALPVFAGAGLKCSPGLLAVGQTTASLVQKHQSQLGGGEVILPKDGTDSESLLALPCLQSVKDQRVGIFKGQGGRTLMADTLKSRGAEIMTFDVYQRLCPNYDEEIINGLWEAEPPEAIVITSVEALENLYAIMSKFSAELCATPLVVVSERIRNRSEALGFDAKRVVVAQTPYTADVVAAVKQVFTDKE